MINEKLKTVSLPENYTRDDILFAIKQAKKIADNFNNKQLSIKIFLNSVYGGLASPYFVGYNQDIAEGITLQGQDIIKFSARILNRYFLTHWHKDFDLHIHLGIKTPQRVTVEPVIYGDTDTCDKDSLIEANYGTVTLEELYLNEFKKSQSTLEILPNGHEVIEVTTDLQILNYSKEGQIVFTRPSKLIRHKLNKAKWELRTRKGKYIRMTNDHSMIVFRNDKKIKVKPQDVRQTDKILVINVFDNNRSSYFDDLDYCKEIGKFDDEYAYDIEMSDETHTFIANDILVHNSVYMTFQEILKSIPGGMDGKEIEIIQKIKEYRLKDYFRKSFEIYANKFHTTNIQDFELETISFAAILLAKKKYVLDIAWDDSNTFFNPQSKVKPKGVEMVQSSTPPFARKHLINLLKTLFIEKKDLRMSNFIHLLRELRKQFELDEIDNITMGSGIGNYEKGIKSDIDEFAVNSHCPMHVKAAGIYNFRLNQNPELKQKYTMIRSGDKVKYYHAVDEIGSGMNVFAYLPGEFPIEIAPPINYDLQFAKSVLSPLNRFLSAMGFPQISDSLVVSRQLF